jgi:hypothetical protein
MEIIHVYILTTCFIIGISAALETIQIEMFCPLVVYIFVQ